MACQTRTAPHRYGEKGAALVISILIATLPLAVAGTVILTSGMSATTSIEGTAELQAYYAAEWTGSDIECYPWTCAAKRHRRYHQNRISQRCRSGEIEPRQ